MKIKEAINWLESKPRFKEKTNLEKMKNALMILGNPQKSFQAIHVTGTNGKGSVSHFLSATLAKVFKVGLFTSPYVIKFNERLQINNLQIEDEVLLKYLNWAKEFDEKYFKDFADNFSFFELLTLIAIKYFSDENVQYAVIEVGIGGRLDSTNVIDSEYAVITSLGLDHVEQLGGSLESILKEKLGVVKQKKTLFTAVTDYKEIINDYIKSKEAKVHYLEDSDYQLLKNYPLTFKYEGNIYTPGLQGLYQVKNAILAIMVLKNLVNDNKMIEEGLKETINPGRFEIVNNNPLIILDGAHNYEAMDKLVISLKTIFKDKNIKVLYGSMADKPYEKMIKRLKELTSEIFLTSLPFPRSLKDFNNEIFQGLTVYNDALGGFKEIKKHLKEDDLLVVTGSMYLVSLIKNNLN